MPRVCAWSLPAGANPCCGAAGSAFLLPQRVARFEEFLARFSAATGLDTGTVGRISPPWTYQLLALLCGLFLLGEGLWAVALLA